MKSHRLIRKHLYEYLRGELPEEERRDTETHLAGCLRCRTELDSIRVPASFLDQHAQRPSEQRGGLYWQQFAVKVERRIEAEREEESAPSIVRQLLDALAIHRKPFGIGFASAMMIMMIAFGVWSVWLKAPLEQRLAEEQISGSTTTDGSATVQKVSVESRAQDYLEQSKILLIGLMNTDSKNLSSSGPMLRREREVSRQLVSESAVLTSSLNDPSQRRLKELISDLQLILVQIANLGTERDLPGVEIIKGGIDHNDIIFKINLEQIHRTTKSAGKPGETVKPTT